MTDSKTTFNALFTGPRDLVQGVEASLLRRRRLSGIGLAVGLLGAVLQVVVGIIDGGYFKALAELGVTVRSIVAGTADRVVLIGLVGLVLFAVGLAAYLLLRWTRLLQRDSEEPFRYTVSMDPFEQITSATPATIAPQEFTLRNIEQLSLLHHDLRERLNERIGRFSLLESRPPTPGAADAPAAARGARPATSHVHIAGKYMLRQDQHDRWLIHVMPTVQLGPEGSPLTMAYPVRYDLGTNNSQILAPARYQQIVERVYSSVATEVYRKIESDVRAKIEWFPTRHLRAVALFHEAQDMARSNTVDAYDRALDLYSSAQRFFDLALLRDCRRWLVKLPLPWLWQVNARYLQMRARVQIGYVRCQIYRQMTALQTGRKPNAIYECTWRMDQVIEDLRAVHARLLRSNPKHLTAKSQVMGYFTFRRDRFLRWLWCCPLEPDFLRQRRILFDAYTVAALAHAALGNLMRARERLDEAVTIDPSMRERDSIYLVAEAEISADLRRRVRLLQEATDLNPWFQIAQYRLAQTIDLLFRDENQLSAKRVANAIKQYDEVLRINPGNIAAIASKGYLFWLTTQPEKAEQCFREGIEFKNIVRETSIAELTYGLARTLAERGEYNDAFDQFMQSVAVDPDVAAWTVDAQSQSRTQGRYYNRINEEMVARYVRYAQKLGEAHQCNAALPADSAQRAVWGFVANDRANAYLNHYFRHGDPESLKLAKQTLQEIEKAKLDNPVVHFNLAIAHTWEMDIDAALRNLDRAVALSPEWQAAQLASIKQILSVSHLKELNEQIRKKEEEHRQLLEEGEQIKAQQVQVEHATAPHSQRDAVTRAPTPDSAAPRTQTLKLDDHSRQIDEKLQSCKDKLHELQGRRDDKLRNFGPNLIKALHDLSRNSRLLHLIDPKPKPESITTPPLPSPRIEWIEWIDNALALYSLNGFRWEQLDRSDVLVLCSLVEFTTTNALKEHTFDSQTIPAAATRNTLEKCTRLNLFLAQRFMHEDIDINLSRMEVEDVLDVPGEKRAETEPIVAHTVAFWLEEDPRHYWALKFWIGWLNDEKLLALGERLICSQCYGTRCLGLLVDQMVRALTSGSEQFSNPDDLKRGLALTLQAAHMGVEQAPAQQGSHYNLGRAYALQEDWPQAVRSFDAAAHAVAAEPPDMDPADLRLARAEVYEKHAEALQRQGLLNASFDAYLVLARIDSGHPGAYEKLLTACAAVVSRARRAEAVASVRKLAKHALERDLTQTRRANMQRLLARLRVGECFGAPGLARFHVMTPIAINVASNLVELVAQGESELHPDLQKETDTLRLRLRSTMGVWVPGLRFREETNLAPGSYLIRLGETPLVLGTLNLTEVFYPGNLDAATIARLKARAQTDSLSGRPGWWLAPHAVDSLGLKPESLLHPRSFMLRHIEAVLRGNLAEFFGHTELHAMIEELQLAAPQSAQAPSERSTLVTALRSLLRERVPIVALGDILTAWPEIRTAHPHLQAQIEALRSLPALCAHLPGNEGEHQLLEIGPKLETTLRDNLHDPAHRPLLALAPEQGRSILAAVRAALAPNWLTAPAVVIHDASLRPHLHALLSAEWPALPVLAVAELSAAAGALPRTVIELE